MKDGDAVRVNLPGDPGHGLIGHIVRIEKEVHWIYLAEHGEGTVKYGARDLLAVQPQL